ncbi:DNA repair protein RadA [BD1-7 clade bacterium]|uniref:DNA repair protein RadA n=1 Tax=BD1-7 clade bacterium TaxID=2029982 RepID=A0A5S9MU87_9GAMM|nr:DNA repair protein RadA [BD1-7 clade bacterium]CAA0083936.1 DNA repair protein RadA [BD1-7 clade bacterium]
MVRCNQDEGKAVAKAKKAFVCIECGGEHIKWQGQCNDCGQWNTLKEIVLESASTPSAAKFTGYAGAAGETRVQTLADVNLEELPRIGTQIGELDRVLGGGLVHGSAVLIGGHPGAGKSTLLLQVLCDLANHHQALYVTGEESPQQIAMRAKRLNLPMDKLRILAETQVADICQQAKMLEPKIMVVDSIQVMHHADVSSAPGSVSQVRECAAYLTRFAKQTGTILFLVGHVTKDGGLAGPKVLEHMIDTSIMLEGSSDSRFRTLRGIKNRFGAVNEIGVFAMTEGGMKEVKNPSAIFLSRSQEAAAGSLVMVVWEGTRPLLVEIQALVDDSPFGSPRRVAVGVDQNRISMLLAVLHRHGGIHAADQDVYINVVGGVKVLETSADLAILLAILSSLRNRVLPQDLVVFGEVGLAGEIRPVPSGIERLHEAAKHGFKRAIIPAGNKPPKAIAGMEVVAVDKLSEALEAL